MGAGRMWDFVGHFSDAVRVDVDAWRWDEDEAVRRARRDVWNDIVCEGYVANSSTCR